MPTADPAAPADPADPADAAALTTAHSRQPVDAALVNAELVNRGLAPPWSVEVVDTTASTNSDLARAAVEGAPHGTVLIAESQTAGRGRLGRQWTAPAGSGLTMSMLLRLPQIPPARRGWIGAVLALAVRSAVGEVGTVRADLKWPNDLLIGGDKCAGILAEVAGDAIVIGVGLNVSLTRDELPRPDATSLQLEGAASLDRAALAVGILSELAPLLDRWSAHSGDALAAGIKAEYTAACITIGAAVRLELPTGAAITGTAVGIDDEGAVLVRDADGTTQAHRAADVVHLRT